MITQYLLHNPNFEKLKDLNEIKIIVSALVNSNNPDFTNRGKILLFQTIAKNIGSFKPEELLNLFPSELRYTDTDNNGMNLLHHISISKYASQLENNKYFYYSIFTLLINVKDNLGRTALHYAYEHGNVHFQHLLKTCYNADTNIKDKSGRIAADYAPLYSPNSIYPAPLYSKQKTKAF